MDEDPVISSDIPSVSLVGLGRMGNAIAEAFLQSGHRVVVWNRSIAKAEPLSALGAIVATSAAECIQLTKLTVVCVVDSCALKDILMNCDATVCSGRTIVNYTSGSPTQIREVEALIKERGFSSYVQGAIEAMPECIGSTETVIWHSGDADCFESAKPILSALGKVLYIDSNPLSASMRELVLGTCLFSLAAGFCQAIALLKSIDGFEYGQTERFATEVAIPTIEQSTYMLHQIAQQTDAQNYVTQGSGATLGLLQVALENITRANDEQGISSVVLEPILELIRARVVDGGRDDGMGAIIDLFKKPNNK